LFSTRTVTVLCDTCSAHCTLHLALAQSAVLSGSSRLQSSINFGRSVPVLALLSIGLTNFLLRNCYTNDRNTEMRNRLHVQKPSKTNRQTRTRTGDSSASSPQSSKSFGVAAVVIAASAAELYVGRLFAFDRC